MNGYRVNIRRLDDVALVNLRCSQDTAAQLTRKLPFELPTAPMRASESTEGLVARLAPDQWWIRTTLDREQAVFSSLKDSTVNEFAAVTIISDHFQGFEIAGDNIDPVLAQATSVNLNTLNDGSVTRGKFARSGGTIFVIEQSKRVQVFVESSYADYIEAYLASIAGATGSRD